jgi:hypothetical protein
MELLNFVLIFACGWLVLRKPHRQGPAFALLVASLLLTVFLFFVGSRSSLLPPLNY